MTVAGVTTPVLVCGEWQPWTVTGPVLPWVVSWKKQDFSATQSALGAVHCTNSNGRVWTLTDERSGESEEHLRAQGVQNLASGTS